MDRTLILKIGKKQVDNLITIRKERDIKKEIE